MNSTLLNANDLQKFEENATRVFNLQKQYQQRTSKPTAAERIKKLKQLKEAVMYTFNEEIKQAVHADLRKHETEAEMNEVVPIMLAINFAIKNLRSWMRDERVPTPLSLFGYSHKIKYDPKGVVLIISPWNFPINLALVPLVSAIAAGNSILIKPSEVTPTSSSLLKKMIDSLYREEEVYVMEGGVAKTTFLLKLPFNHIFFTGSPQVGKIVMKAAAENLTSVSLELGGKSPTIIDRSANIEQTASRIAWAKFLNNGQICIAPDYILIHESIKDQFIEALKIQIEKQYGNLIANSDSYGRIVNGKHFKRLKKYLDDASALGAYFELEGALNEEDNFIGPTIISNLPDHALLWKEEIFGPILPIRTFTHIDQTIEYINEREKPLALYLYSQNKKHQKLLAEATRSGGMVVNYSTTHYVNPNLPFGGSNNSGIGKTNGYFGFKAFSEAKGIQKHWASSLDILKLIYPPYSNKKSKLAKFITKWFT